MPDSTRPPPRVVASTDASPTVPRGRRQRGISLLPFELARAIAAHGGGSSKSDVSTSLALSRWASVFVGAHYMELNARLRHFFQADDASSSSASGSSDGDEGEAVGACSDLCALLASAEYTLLPPPLYTAALDASFYFFVPNGTDWSKLDAAVLPKLYASMSAAGAAIMRDADPRYANGGTGDAGSGPTFVRHLLISVRGQHLEERTERFLDRKVDLVILLLWFGAAWVVGAVVSLAVGPRTGGAVAAWMRDLIDGVLPGREADRVEEEEEKSFSAATPSRHSGGGGRPSTPPPLEGIMSPLKAVVAGSRRQPGLCAGRVTVDEAILRDGLFRNFLGHSTAREPCFDDVVVVYREKDNAATAPPPWRLTAFRNVPLADLEMVLPHKTLGLLPIDTLRTVTGGVALFVCLYFTLAEAASPPPSSVCGGDGDAAGGVIGAAIGAVQEEVSLRMHFVVAMTIAATIAGRLVALIFSYMTTQTAYFADIQQWLLQRRVANGRDVVSKLADEVQQQDAAEIVLGMYALCAVYAKHGSDGATTDAVRDTAEAVLKRAGASAPVAPADSDSSHGAVPPPSHASAAVEFDVDDALEKLVTVGLATRRLHPSCGTTYAPTIAYADVPDWVRQHPASKLFDCRLRGGHPSQKL